jgi:hypothetical protein
VSYLDNGFDLFLDKTSPPSGEVSAIDQDAITDSISGSKISSGTISSNDGRSNLNLDDSLYSVSDGLVNRVEMGQFDDGEYGLRIRDRDGNLLIDITGTRNLLQSADGKFQIDLTDKQLRVYDQFNLRVLLGLLAAASG